jgi:hypothetical protein
LDYVCVNGGGRAGGIHRMADRAMFRQRIFDPRPAAAWLRRPARFSVEKSAQKS